MLCVCTFVALRVFGHLDGVVSWEDPSSAGPHVVALVPVVFRLDLHQQRIIYLQLQLVVMSGDKPAQTDVDIQRTPRPLLGYVDRLQFFLFFPTSPLHFP